MQATEASAKWFSDSFVPNANPTFHLIHRNRESPGVLSSPGDSGGPIFTQGTGVSGDAASGLVITGFPGAGVGLRDGMPVTMGGGEYKDLGPSRT